jgi:hypothetical protein
VQLCGHVTLVQVKSPETLRQDINQLSGLGPILVPCKHDDDEYNVSDGKDNQARSVQISDRLSPPCVSLLLSHR